MSKVIYVVIDYRRQRSPFERKAREWNDKTAQSQENDSQHIKAWVIGSIFRLSVTKPEPEAHIFTIFASLLFEELPQTRVFMQDSTSNPYF